MIVHFLAGTAIVDVFTSGINYSYYRIPALVRLLDGRISAFAEGRNVDADVGWIDIVYKTSLDSTGDAWGPLRILYSETTNASHTVSINNPSPVADVARGSAGPSIVVVFARNVKQLVMMRSLDPYGQQLPASPVDITQALRLPYTPAFLLPGPPGGILLPSGRLATTVYFKPHPNSTACLSRALISDDGTTWNTSTSLSPGGESQIALAPNGSLVINIRAGGGAPAPRLTSWSSDGGMSWSIPVTTNFTGGSVEGSMVRLSGTDWLVLSHPFDGWAQNTSAFPHSVCTNPSWHPGRCMRRGASGEVHVGRCMLGGACWEVHAGRCIWGGACWEGGASQLGVGGTRELRMGMGAHANCACRRLEAFDVALSCAADVVLPTLCCLRCAAYVVLPAMCGRCNMTLWGSRDSGASWVALNQV